MKDSNAHLSDVWANAVSTAPLWHLTIQIKGGLEEAQGDAP